MSNIGAIIMTDQTNQKMSRIVTRIHSQIMQLVLNIPYRDDDEGIEDEIIFDVATLILRDVKAALELCNINDNKDEVIIYRPQGSKNKKMRLAARRIRDNAGDLKDELEADSDLDVVVHMLNSIVRDTNILLSYSKLTD